MRKLIWKKAKMKVVTLRVRISLKEYRQTLLQRISKMTCLMKKMRRMKPGVMSKNQRKTFSISLWV